MLGHFPELFDQGGRIVRVAGGFQFTEGPVWLQDSGRLLFSDIPGNTIYQFTPERKAQVFRRPSSHANGLACDHKGRLIACEHATRRLTRIEEDGSLTVLADSFEGKRLNSPNDVAQASDGSIYFTDPPYGIREHEQDLPFQGVFRLSPEGNLQLVAPDFHRPNGLVFSPDGSRLYIDDSSRRCHVRYFDVRQDGTLANDRIFYDMSGHGTGNPDGMTVDRKGRLYCTGPGGVWVLDPDGVHLGTIVTPEQPSNCVFGGQDLRTLFITAVSSVYAVQCTTPGRQS